MPRNNKKPQKENVNNETKTVSINWFPGHMRKTQREIILFKVPQEVFQKRIP